MARNNPQYDKELKMTFDPNIIDDLGARLYSTLPPIIAELIANGYDACAKEIRIHLIDEGGDKKIIIYDNGAGMDFDDINEKYLLIGRKRREIGEKKTSCGRLPIGKKGIGKLAFFGVAKDALVETVTDNIKIAFEMSWDKIKSSGKIYKPNFKIIKNAKESNGTKITLSGIFRKTDFDVDSLKKSISNYFIFDKNFRVFIKKNHGKFEEISNEIRYEHSDRGEDFSWKFPETGKNIQKEFSFADKIKGKIILFNKPVRSNLRGVTLFSRKKLVNLPESFPVQGSSHFFQYLTGWLEIDFIDDLKPDVISTNRSSLTWTDDSLQDLKEYLGDVINFIHKDWRKKKEEKIKEKVSSRIKIDPEKWKESNKNNETISKNIDKFYKLLSDPEKIEEDELMDVSEIIYNLAPEYADFVLWRNLNKKIKDNVIIKEKFFAEKYLEASREAVQIYNEEVQTISGSKEDGCPLMDLCFKKDGSALIHLTDKSCESEQNIDLGHQFLSKGVITGFRNPALGHTSLTKAKKIKTFSDRNCLDILSTISYLFDRLERRKNPNR